MNRRAFDILSRYGLAVVATAAALFLRAVVLQPVLGHEAPFLLFTLSVFLSALIGGVGPGLLATVLSAVAGSVWLVEPYGRWSIAHPVDQIRIATFVTIGLLISWMSGLLVHTREQALAERSAMSETEERLRLFIEAVPDYALFMMDPQGHIISWNAGAQKIKGYSADEIIGRDYAIFFTPEDQQAGLPDRILRTAAERGVFNGEGWRRRKDGSLFFADVELTALRDAGGRLRGFGKVTRDVTERRQAEQEIHKLNADLERRIEERTAQLREINLELEAFAYSISHDLRAPLRAVQGFAQALLEDYGEKLEPTGQEFARRLVAAAADLDRLILDLLEYSRLSRDEVKLEDVPVESAIKAAVAAMAEQVSRSGARIEVSPTPCAVRANAAVLNQILTNLIGNAIKFIAPGVTPQVRIWCDRRDPFVRLNVQDNGVGISPDHHRRIFNVFERLHGSEAYPGTGIGLAIVRKGAERLGGRAGIESAAGQGSTFWVELPEGPTPP